MRDSVICNIVPSRLLAGLHVMQHWHISLFAIIIGLSTGCSSVSPENAIDYAGEQQATHDLAIPPDLTTTPRSSLLAVPDLPASNSDQPGIKTTALRQSNAANKPAVAHPKAVATHAPQTPHPPSDFNTPHLLLPGTSHQVWTQILMEDLAPPRF